MGEGGKKIQEAEPRGLWMPPLARSCLKHFKKMHRSILTRYLMIKKFPSFCNQVTSSQEIFSNNFFVDRLVCLEVVENMTFKKVCSVDPDLLHFLVKKAKVIELKFRTFFRGRFRAFMILQTGF